MNINHFQSGQIVVGTNGEVFQTVLGSCVAMCFYDAKQKIGGMIHYLLPSKNLVSANLPVAQNSLNFADEAIPRLFKELKKRGSHPRDCQVFLFGGCQKSVRSDVVAKILPNVGRANIDAAHEIIGKFGFRVTKERVGLDVVSLIVRFDSATGEISLQKRNGDAGKDPLFEQQQEPQLSRPIRVLIVDDSDPIRRVIKSSLSKYSEIEIVGEAANPIEAEKLRKKVKPDVMTLDIQMPFKDGVTYLRELMPVSPMPIIIVSDLNLKEVSPVMTALELGAFDYLQKPAASEIPRFASELKDKVVAAGSYSGKMSKIKSRASQQLMNISAAPLEYDKNIELIAIGSSTGGTEALREVFSYWPAQTPPIVIVQHIPPVFSKAFADSLNQDCKIGVKEAEDGDILQNSMAYIAPGGKQMHLEKKGDQLRIRVTDAPPVNRFKPSVDYLFNSIVKLDVAKNTNAALLTGMGDDGARGLLQLKNSGAITYAQSEETCVVYGMPKVAVELKAVDKVVDLSDIAKSLMTRPKVKKWESKVG